MPEICLKYAMLVDFWTKFRPTLYQSQRGNRKARHHRARSPSHGDLEQRMPHKMLFAVLAVVRLASEHQCQGRMYRGGYSGATEHTHQNQTSPLEPLCRHAVFIDITRCNSQLAEKTEFYDVLEELLDGLCFKQVGCEGSHQKIKLDCSCLQPIL